PTLAPVGPAGFTPPPTPPPTSSRPGTPPPAPSPHAAATTPIDPFARPDTRPYRLVVTSGGDVGTAFLLHDGLRIGRIPSHADFVLADPEVSSLHARVERDGGPPILIDANSTNGTFVNDERITSHP